MKSLILSGVVIFGTSCISSSVAADREWLLDAADVTTVKLNEVIHEAIVYLGHGTNLNSVATITLPAGRFYLESNPDAAGTLLFNELYTGKSGKLVFRGQGRGKTTLVFNDFEQVALFGKMVNGLTLQDMHFTRAAYSATQGNVVSSRPGEIIIDIHDGYPSPEFLWRFRDLGHYLRRATNSTTEPLIIQTNNDQVKYGYRGGLAYPPQFVDGNKWLFYLADEKLDLASRGYKPGDYVAIKAKKSGFPYQFLGGERLTMDNVKWTHSTRGIIRGATDNDGNQVAFNDISISNCLIATTKGIAGQAPILSASGGGIQLNQPDDLPMNNISVSNCRLDSTGDDNLALFNVNNVRLENIKSINAFARSILVTTRARNVCAENVSIINGVIEDENHQVVTIAGCH
ncbi:hypothetical protein [Shewanella sp. GXUN23E]|uniref:hypothetical protein n=1 Tax=Shewanella sp. GXUN23E TaxID=3422498 RepID=UPI003D7CC3EE